MTASENVLAFKNNHLALGVGVGVGAGLSMKPVRDTNQICDFYPS